MSRHASIEIRLANAIAISARGCHEFQGAKAGNGYGVIGFRGRQNYAHRVMWQLYHGDIPNGLKVLHNCDNPCCINIAHLFLGTSKHNSEDMVRKGRHRTGNKTSFLKYREAKALLRQGYARNVVVQLTGLSKTAVRNIDTGVTQVALYNFKTRDGVYICTKFDDDLNPIEGSSYEVSGEACTCPAGQRDTCRHRHMLDIFQREDAIDQPAFYDYDRGLWQGMEELPPPPEEAEQIDLFAGEGDKLLKGIEASSHGQGERTGEGEITPETRAALIASVPDGIVVMGLDDMGALHNAIADAVSEPEAKLRPQTLTLRRRNLTP